MNLFKWLKRKSPAQVYAPEQAKLRAEEALAEFYTRDDKLLPCKHGTPTISHGNIGFVVCCPHDSQFCYRVNVRLGISANEDLEHRAIEIWNSFVRGDENE